MNFNEKLQKLRKESKLSQEQLADMLDVTRQSVSKWESGTTYPEMDKLITMCKIFKCSLDDLTNDEITDIQLETKKNNQFNNVIDSILEIVEKTVKMFKSMSFAQIVKCVFSLFLLGLFLLLFRIPFEILENGFYNIISTIGRPAIESFISGVFNFIIDIIYLVLYIFVFVYVYKIAYLDKYEFVKQAKISDQKIIVESDIEIQKEKKIKIIENKNNSNNTIFHLLGKLIIGFIKFLVACFTLPVIVIILVLFALIAIDIFLLFKGINYLGVFLGILFCLLMGVVFIEISACFIFNKKIAFKRLLWTFIISLGGIGIAAGILSIEISNTEYVNKLPKQIKSATISKEYPINENIVIGNEISYYHNYSNFYYYYYINTNYIVDETKANTVKLEVIYNDDFIDAAFIENENAIGVDAQSESEFNQIKKIMNIFLENLANKEVYNYNQINHVTLNIYTSSKNIEILKNNVEKISKQENLKQMETEQNNYKNEYNEMVSNYEERIEGYEEKIFEFENQISILKDKNLELSNKLEEYREKLSSILEE